MARDASAAGDNGMRRMVERVVQHVLEAEMTALWEPTVTNGPASVVAIGTARIRAR